MLKFSEFLEEGKNDPAIFKAVFLAGSPGAGKSHVVEKIAFESLGFRNVNSDVFFEHLRRKAGLPRNVDPEKEAPLRGKASGMMDKKEVLYLMGRLGLVIDGTGKNYNKIANYKKELEDLGYETAMIYVSVPLDVSLYRNSKRDRVLPDDMVIEFWHQVDANYPKFKKLFGKSFIKIDNQDSNPTLKAEFAKHYRTFMTWAKKKITNPIAQKWIKEN